DRRHALCGTRRAVRRAGARRRAAGARLLAIRLLARRAVRRLPGAGRRALGARRLRDRVSARSRRRDCALPRPAQRRREVTTRVRLAVFSSGLVLVAALLVDGVSNLPPFGRYAGPYGDIVARLVEPQRHMANAVTAVVFDYRGFDTMGEELILFAAASAVALLLREMRDHDTSDLVEGIRSDALRGVGALAAIVTFVLALQVVAHGFITPGVGFQGGVVLSAAFALVFLTNEYRAYNRLASSSFAEPVEALGAGGYVFLGLLALALG